MNVDSAVLVKCPVKEPAPPVKTPRIDEDSKPIELRYFEKSDSGIANDIANYIKRTTQVEIIPVPPAPKPIKAQNLPKKEKIELDIYFLKKKEQVNKPRGEH
jgi:hypothetical protein